MSPQRVGVAEIAELFGVAPNTAWRWTRRDDFPEPAEHLAQGPTWRKPDVEAWGREHLPLPTGRPPKATPGSA